MIAVGCEPGTAHIVFRLGDKKIVVTPDEALKFAETLKKRYRIKNKIKASMVCLNGEQHAFQGTHEQAILLYAILKKTLDLVPQAMAMDPIPSNQVQSTGAT